MGNNKILNVRVDNLTMDELLEKYQEGVLVTPNVDDVMKHQRDKEFHEAADAADFSVCDSKVLLLSSKLIGLKLKEAIPGSSFFPRYCDYHAKDDNCKIFLLGAKEGVAAKAMNIINERIGRNIIVGSHSPSFGFEKNPEECEQICEMLNNSGANVILVGLGNPKQTKFIFNYKDKAPNIKSWMALGATIDFEAGNIKRAPKFFQVLALEWLYRMFCEPKRMFKRYICDDLVFFWYLFKQVIGKYKNPWEK